MDVISRGDLLFLLWSEYSVPDVPLINQLECEATGASHRSLKILKFPVGSHGRR